MAELVLAGAKKPSVGDEQTKAGDDYAARIYLIVKEGVLPWQLRVLSYVWAANQPSETWWPNAYTDRVTMLSVRGSDNGPTDQWFCEQRNIQEDLQKALGKPVKRVDAVAIMTDSDDTESEAKAWFGEVRVHAQPILSED